MHLRSSRLACRRHKNPRHRLDTPASGCEQITVGTITDDGDHLTVNAKLASAPIPSAPTICTTVVHSGAFAFLTIAKIVKPVTLVSYGDVHFDVVAKGTFDGSPQNRFFVLQSDTELAAALAEFTVRSNQPITAGFTSQTLLGVFVAHPSPCDETTVTSITQDTVSMTVNVNHVSHPDAICITSIVSGSFEFVTIPKTSKPVSFNITKVAANTDGPIQFNKVSAGYYQGTLQEPLLVIQSATGLRTSLAGITLLSDTPIADFSTQTLIGVFINTEASGCNTVAVSTINQDANHMTVTAMVNPALNPSDPMTCTVVTHSGVYVFVTIAKTAQPVTLVLGSDVHFEAAAHGAYLGTPQQQQLVIQSDAGLAAALTGVTQMNNESIRVNVDFSTQTLLGIFVTHAVGCDGGTYIAKITDTGVGLIVNANHITYGTVPCPTVFYNGTYAFVALSKTTKPATFIVTETGITH
ncbi:MAG: hypothetical protein HY273_11970 [Gammaproteobacteria bacterium]|nr:hypothetical protein [Gammaproteobacteria bacterium]